jgi:spore maturation protein CgeB
MYLAPFLRNRLGNRLTRFNQYLRSRGAKWLNENLLNSVQDASPDFVFITNGDFLSPETIRTIRIKRCPIYIFHADNPFQPSPNARPEYLPCAVEASSYFIWSQSLISRLQKLGVKDVRYLPFAWDEEIFPPSILSSHPEYDLVFIGGWDRDREALLAPLARHFNLKIWGPDYWATRTRRDSLLRFCWQGGAAEGPEAALIISRAKITLNILRKQNLPDGINMRTFEVPGCGGFLLSTSSTGAIDIFPEEKAGAYFSDFDECAQRINHYLLDGISRKNISEAAHQIVRRNHTYVHRASYITELFEKSTRSSILVSMHY